MVTGMLSLLLEEVVNIQQFCQTIHSKMPSGLQVSIISNLFLLVKHSRQVHLPILASFFLATNPPTDHTSSFDHHNALTDLSGQGVYMQHEKYLYHFTCDESSCEWEIMQQQFGKSLYDPVMMYLPSSYGCLASVTTTTTYPTTTGTLTTTTQTTTTSTTSTTSTSKQLSSPLLYLYKYITFIVF